ADPDRSGGGDAARLGDRRPRRRDGRKLRADGARRGRRPGGRDHSRRDEPAEHDADPCEPALLPQRLRAPAPTRTRRTADTRPGRRDHGRRVRDASRRGRGARLMPAQWIIELTVLVLAAFLGVEVISKVPTLLHTPLMSGTNAIHGIVLVGAM